MSETFRDFSRKQLRHSFQNINLRVQENILRKFFYRIDGILVVSFLERKTLGCWLKINDKVFKTTTSISREIIRDKIFFKIFFLKLYFRQNFFNSGQSNSAGVVKTTFGVSRGILWAFFIDERMIFNIFFHFEQNHCWLLPNIYGRVSETSIYVSGEVFWGKNWKKKICY